MYNFLTHDSSDDDFEHNDDEEDGTIVLGKKEKHDLNQRLYHFLVLLEKLYPNPCFVSSYNRAWAFYLANQSRSHGPSPLGMRIKDAVSRQVNVGDDFTFACGNQVIAKTPEVFPWVNSSLNRNTDQAFDPKVS